METAAQYQNPFDLETVPTELINIATGYVASAEVVKSLQNFLTDAEKKQSKFLESSLFTETKI